MIFKHSINITLIYDLFFAFQLYLIILLIKNLACLWNIIYAFFHLLNLFHKTMHLKILTSIVLLLPLFSFADNSGRAPDKSQQVEHHYQDPADT